MPRVPPKFSKSHRVKALPRFLGFLGSMACLDIWKNDGVEITSNDRRTRSTSSYVTFTDIERLIGDDAKRLIDRKLADPFEQSDMDFWSFKGLSDASYKQMIQI